MISQFMENSRRPLKICFIANAHSVHVKRFISYFAASDNDVTIVTPDLCLYEIPGVKVLNVRDLSASEKVRRAVRDVGTLRRLREVKRRATAEVRHILLSGSQLLKSADERIKEDDDAERRRWSSAVERLASAVGRLIRDGNFDIVQSLRFYPEGLITAALDHPRKCIFAWGSDLSGFATWYPEVSSMTREALQNCAGFLHDNCKDYRFGLSFGLASGTPHLLVPSNGGIDTREEAPELSWNGKEAPAYATIRRIGNLFMNNEPVIRALALLHREHGVPATYTMYSDQYGPYYDRLRVLAQELGIWKYLRFKQPYAPREVFQKLANCPLQVSPARDDGTSAALLETMWCGAIPIYSDVESIREWITDGNNGYLFDMKNPEAIAAQMIRAWKERDKWPEIAAYNHAIVRDRADYQSNMAKVMEFYQSLN